MSQASAAHAPRALPPPTPALHGGKDQVKKPGFGVFSPYNLFYYCPRCATWVLKELALRDSRGRPTCPRCLANLRTRPRNPARRWEP